MHVRGRRWIFYINGQTVNESGGCCLVGTDHESCEELVGEAVKVVAVELGLGAATEILF